MSEEEKKNQQIEDKEDDSDDDDYVPSDDEDKGNSDEEEFDSDENLDNQPEEVLKCIDNKKLTEDEEKKRAEELWAYLLGSSTSDKTNFKSSTVSPNKLTTSSNSSSINKSTNSKSALNDVQTAKPDKIKITKEYEFAGEKIKIEEEIDCNKLETNSKPTKSTMTNPMKRGLGINSLVANLGKKQKLTTLCKTKLDWDMFKKEKGLEEDLKNHTKNKTSFVEKQAFLHRTDLKQFELEKSVREKNRILKN